jgi:hypothetical protein
MDKRTLRTRWWSLSLFENLDLWHILKEKMMNLHRRIIWHFSRFRRFGCCCYQNLILFLNFSWPLASNIRGIFCWVFSFSFENFGQILTKSLYANFFKQISAFLFDFLRNVEKSKSNDFTFFNLLAAKVFRAKLAVFLSNDV